MVVVGSVVVLEVSATVVVVVSTVEVVVELSALTMVVAPNSAHVAPKASNEIALTNGVALILLMT